VSPPDGGTMPAYSWEMALPTNGQTGECALLVRADLQGGGAIELSRALSDTKCQNQARDDIARLDWALIDFGPAASSQKVSTNLGLSGKTATTAIAAVDPTLTLVVTGQNSGLLGGGEDRDINQTQGPAEGLAVHVLAGGDPATQVVVARRSGANSGRWTAWIVTFEP
jgi:hypothetical protein